MPRSISAAIRRDLLPKLHELGFVGDFPRLLRLRGDGYDLVEFQISWRGGGFWINLGRFPEDGVIWDNERVPAGQVTIGVVPFFSRTRLGWHGKVHEGFFIYAAPDGTNDFDACVRTVLPLIDGELETRIRKLTFDADERTA